MPDKSFHLAQFNIARMRAPLDDPMMADFVAQLDYINSVADRAEGFVWRMQTDEGDSTAIRAYGDEPIIVNMSVWKSLESLHDYVYRSDHLAPMRRRKEWFLKSEGPNLVLWWIPVSEIPTVWEGKARLAHLAAHGPTPHAFTFRQYFPPPGESDEKSIRFDYTGCEWGS